MRFSGSEIVGGAHYAEGLSQGMPLDCGEAYETIDPSYVPCGPDSWWMSTKFPGPRKDVPYGVWFFPAPGSGVAVNVGRSLRLLNRRETYAAVNLTGGVGDRLFCTYAMDRGYDSIQWAQAFDDVRLPELVICSGAAATTRVKTSCPPLKLKAVTEDKKSACKCDPSRETSNCGGALPTPPAWAMAEWPALKAEGGNEKWSKWSALAIMKEESKCPALDDGKGTRRMDLVENRQGDRDGYPLLHLAWDVACRNGKFSRCMYFCEQPKCHFRLDGVCRDGDQALAGVLGVV